MVSTSLANNIDSEITVPRLAQMNAAAKLLEFRLRGLIPNFAEKSARAKLCISKICRHKFCKLCQRFQIKIYLQQREQWWQY